MMHVSADIKTDICMLSKLTEASKNHENWAGKTTDNQMEIPPLIWQ